MSDPTRPAAGADQDLAGRLERLWRQGDRPDVRAFLAGAGGWPPAQVVAVLRVDQCRRWEEGERPPAEAYLGMRPGLSEDEEGAVELIYGEFLLREERGEAPEEEEYLRRFPRHAARLRQQFELHRAMAAQETTSEAGAAPREGGPAGRFGRYRIVKMLGQGGMGTVYHAHDTQLDRPVALKVMRFGGGDAEEVQRFYREARIAASFTHPNLCPVYDFSRTDGHYYLTMPLLAGEPLSALLRREGPLSGPAAARLVASIARAVHEAHRAGVVHRDLKPANVMMTGGRQPVVLDFGLARRVNSVNPRMTRAGAILGTPAYMAPEQIAGDADAGGPAQDVYSLGVLLYETLTGRLPFEGTVEEMLMRAVAGTPTPPSRHRAGLDPGLERLCLKAMAKDPKGRFPSMEAFAESLERWLEADERATKQGGAAPAPREKARPKPRRGRRLLWPAGLLLGAAAVALGAAAVWWTRPHTDPATPGRDAPVQKDERDVFQAKSLWRGSFHWIGDESYQGKVDLKVEERDGEQFKGTYDADEGRYVWRIEGTVKGRVVWWQFTAVVHEDDPKTVVGHATVEGELKGEQLDARYHDDDSIANMTLRLAR